jgi:hypothetical protein
MESIMEIEYFGDGKFDFIIDEHTKFYYANAHDSISKCNLWNWLRNYNYDTKEFFSLHDCKEFTKIVDNLYEGHSGYSVMITMNTMNYIAKNGYENFKENFGSS